ncbi:hypothetical protein [Vineibacter terrae]|uniref:hypothetical protein n=1 Tax=Vineibacter terrae TaxID=2586908 RepID=UPI002E378B12|nr:hypothetical protein [Vineibacter terrae]HEX2888794.1 hypothetical protein [Vineibacter terrae]
MARQKINSEFTAFDVVYEDGSRSSNRKVASSEVAGPNGHAVAKAIIEAQDRKIAELSGRPRGAIKSITRSSGR